MGRFALKNAVPVEGHSELHEIGNVAWLTVMDCTGCWQREQFRRINLGRVYELLLLISPMTFAFLTQHS